MLARIVFALLLALGVGFVYAQEPLPPDRAKAIAPFVNFQTAYVGYVDLSKVDLDAVEKLAIEKLPMFIPQDELARGQVQVRAGMAMAKQFKKELADCGANVVYWVLDAETMRREPGFLAIPGGEKAEALQSRLQALWGTKVIVGLSGQHVLVSGQHAAAELNDFVADERPELATAMAQSKAPVVLAIMFPQELRKQIIDRAGSFPARLGGGPVVPLVENYQWTMLELQPPPAVQIHGVLQMKDTASAKLAQDLISAFVASTKEREKVDLTALASPIKPAAEAGRLVADLSSADFDKALVPIGASMQRAREQAKKVMSASNIRQLMMACIMYANENKGQYPGSIDDLRKYLGAGADRVMTNPTQPQRKPSYIYIKPSAEALKQASSALVIHEAFDQWPGGVNVGYADGHVEWVADEARFRQELAASKAGAAK